MTTQTGHAELERNEVRREGYTMALYVAVCLVAALAAVDDERHAPTMVIVWGTTVGLALAHLFAFHFASRLVEGMSIGRHLTEIASAQMLGAAVVAAVTSIPALMLDAPDDVVAARWVLSALIGLPAYLLGRSRGAGRLRSSVLAVIVLLTAGSVAFVKNALLGH